MTGEKSENSLISVSDILGASRPATRLVEAIERGVGNLLQPWQSRRIAKAEISNFENWNHAVEKSGLTLRCAELTLQDRATVRVIADDVRHQQNREAIAIEAITDFKDRGDGPTEEIESEIDAEWIDRFWRLAQDISDVEMQKIWGRVLARQSSGHGRYSPRSLETISMLSRTEANALQQIAAVACKTMSGDKPDWAIMTSVSGNYVALADKQINKQMQFAAGERYSKLFGPTGIYLDSGGTSWAYSIGTDVKDQTAFIWIAKTRYVLRFPGNQKDGCVHFGAGTGISQVGAEILDIIDTNPKADYVAELASGLAKVGISLREG